ncbi:3495_t:CDS:2 [Ambispora leptoticha]|uniref:3495_t:CDS:1 n=1 Tax=Ambispora leptoticha TaxID=144679 RepID=A0A9N9EW89_9GLOM|nr:3495_t:CDS:2 [Ambispora leptoticha]
MTSIINKFFTGSNDVDQKEDDTHDQKKNLPPARIIKEGSTALEGVGTNPTGQNFHDDDQSDIPVARVTEKGSTALGGVGSNPTGQKFEDEPSPEIKRADSQPHKDQSTDNNLPEAHVINEGSTALEGVGTNPTGQNFKDEQPSPEQETVDSQPYKDQSTGHNLPDAPVITEDQATGHNLPDARVIKVSSELNDGIKSTDEINDTPPSPQHSASEPNDDKNNHTVNETLSKEGYEKLVKGEVDTNPGSPTTQDKASGAIDKAIGTVKEKVGKIVGSESIIESGKDQKAEGEARMHGESYVRQRKL